MKSDIAEIYRLLNNLHRTGTILEVNLTDGLCRVQTGELQTTWLNWLTSRGGRSRTWWAPSVGEQVLLLSIGGDLTTAFDGHRFSLADRGAYTGVTASWLHTREPKQKPAVKVKRHKKKTTSKPTNAPEPKQGDYLVGTDENVLVLSRTYANRANAERAAKASWERIQRGAASFLIQLAKGRADLFPELPVRVNGFKSQVDEADWIITTVTNSISDSGFTTSLELEVKIDDLEME